MLNDIEQLCKKIGVDLSTVQKNGGIETQWPFLIPEVEHFIGNEFMFSLYDMLNKPELSNTKNIRFPSQFSQYVILIHASKSLPLEKRIKIITKIIELQKKQRKDYLCKDNNQLTNFDIKKHINNYYTDENKKTQVKLISSLLYSFYEKIYPTLMRLGYEYHGPYIYNNKKYVVKEYFEMNSYYTKDIPCFNWNNIKIIEEYAGVLTIDYFGHVSGDYTIKNAFLYIDDKYIEDPEEIFKITKEKYLQLLELQKDYQIKDYAKELTKGIFWSLDRNSNTYTPSKELLNKLDSFKTFYPKEKILSSISSKPIEVLEKEIFNSFYNIFKE